MTSPTIPTREAVEKLKNDWLYDPCWDIGDTQEGFEHYKDELWEFQRKQEDKWEAEQKAKVLEKCNKYECSPGTLRYIESLQYQIEKIQERLDKLEGY